MPRVYAYVDGFNFYYSAVKNTPYKWLNFRLLSEFLAPQHDVRRIRYFTSRVHGRPVDPEQPQRQQAYLRALETVPDLRIHYGQFQTNRPRRLLARPPRSGNRMSRVIETREKGSDVNLASYLLWDAFRERYDLAMVFSNDSDLEKPIEIVANHLGRQVIVFAPDGTHSKKLGKVATSMRTVRTSALRASQFPDRIIDADGRTITKPASW